MIETTDASFEEDVLRSPAPVLVEFTAPWCRREHEGRLRVAQLDIEDHLGTPARYGVLSLPTVIIFADGEVVETIDGAQPRRRYAEAVARVLGT